MSGVSTPVPEVVEALYRAESRRVLATLIRLLGDFDLAEEALHEAFAAALEKWPSEGLPRNPRAWLVSVGRFRAIDHLRRRAAFDERRRARVDLVVGPLAMDAARNGRKGERQGESGGRETHDRLQNSRFLRV